MIFSSPSKLVETCGKLKYKEYDVSIAEKICMLIACSSAPLNKICCDLGISLANMYAWRVQDKSFCDGLVEAHRHRAQIYVDEIITISDDSSRDTQVNEWGDEIINKEHIMRDKIRIESRKWIASKLIPKMYGTAKEEDGKMSYEKLLKEIMGE